MVVVNKKVQLELIGLNGNAYAIMGAFRKAARRAEWKEDEIVAVIREAKSSGYDHLVGTIISHCE